jgi:opacity protein-like surface antigen
MQKKSLLFLCAVLSGSASAGNMGSLTAWQKFATINLGPSYTNPGLTQIIDLQPDLQKAYVTNDNTDVLFTGEIYLGAQKSINDVVMGQLGMAFSVSTPAQLRGVIEEDANVSLNNFTYKYKIQHENVAIRGKLLSNTDLFLTPYITGSLGIGFNRSYDYSSSPIISQEIPSPPFAANTEVAFTYTLGAGFQRAINSNWQAGVGYEFVNWGESSLGRMSGQTTNSGIKLNHLYTHELQFSITYLVGG